MIQHPNINPILLQVGPLKIHWYGIMYLLGFVAAWFLSRYRARKTPELWSDEQIADIIFYGIIGVLLGGRLGYVLFYNFSFYASNPMDIFKVWDGGMSFHGGVIGVIIAHIMCGRKIGKSLFQIGDLVLPSLPIGLGLGRIGNFINGELWGSVTSLPWGVVFPKDPTGMPRHPSELYEFALEGVVLFTILWIYSSKQRPRMAVSGLFLLTYGVFRFLVEFVRLPDRQIGYIAWDWLTMGQLLTIPMMAFGIFFIIAGYKKYPLIDGINRDDVEYLAKGL
jgi:phosphatidylglycerol:prolipoprotein diacylglycerol transferase